MNKSIFSGKWDQFKGKMKEQWGKLTDEDFTTVNGKREQFIGKLKERYGWAKEKAEEEFNKFERACGFNPDSSTDSENVHKDKKNSDS